MQTEVRKYSVTYQLSKDKILIICSVDKVYLHVHTKLCRRTFKAEFFVIANELNNQNVHSKGMGSVNYGSS